MSSMSTIEALRNDTVLAMAVLLFPVAVCQDDHLLVAKIVLANRPKKHLPTIPAFQ